MNQTAYKMLPCQGGRGKGKGVVGISLSITENLGMLPQPFSLQCPKSSFIWLVCMTGKDE
jgi:hypothetical protein